MINFVLVGSSFTRVEITPPESQAYSIDEAADRTSIHPQLLRHYCRIGLLGEARARENVDPVFDDDALYAIRRIEHYRHQHGVNLRALPFLLNLLNEVEHLRAEVKYLRTV